MDIDDVDIETLKSIIQGIDAAERQLTDYMQYEKPEYATELQHEQLIGLEAILERAVENLRFYKTLVLD